MFGNLSKKLAKEHGYVERPKRYKYTTVKQVGGDDGYQWAVFVNGKEKVNGLTRREASYYRDKFELEETEKRKPS